MPITSVAFPAGKKQLSELVGHLDLSKDNLQPEVLYHAEEAYVLLSTYLQPPSQDVLEGAHMHLKIVREHLVRAYGESGALLKLCDGALQKLSA